MFSLVIECGPVLIDEHRVILEAPYTSDEGRKALMAIPGSKSFRPYGFGSYFYRDVWEVVGTEIVDVVLDIL